VAAARLDRLYAGVRAEDVMVGPGGGLEGWVYGERITAWEDRHPEGG